MKKFADLPVYFIIIGLILNVIMYFYNRVSFTNLMIRSSIVIILFAAIGYFLSYALNEAHSALASNKQKKSVSKDSKADSSTIDVRVDSDEDELLKIIPMTENDEFVEINPESFKAFMNKE